MSFFLFVEMNRVLNIIIIYHCISCQTSYESKITVKYLLQYIRITVTYYIIDIDIFYITRTHTHTRTHKHTTPNTNLVRWAKIVSRHLCLKTLTPNQQDNGKRCSSIARKFNILLFNAITFWFWICTVNKYCWKFFKSKHTLNTSMRFGYFVWDTFRF